MRPPSAETPARLRLPFPGMVASVRAVHGSGAPATRVSVTIRPAIAPYRPVVVQIGEIRSPGIATACTAAVATSITHQRRASRPPPTSTVPPSGAIASRCTAAASGPSGTVSVIRLEGGRAASAPRPSMMRTTPASSATAATGASCAHAGCTRRAPGSRNTTAASWRAGSSSTTSYALPSVGRSASTIRPSGDSDGSIPLPSQRARSRCSAGAHQTALSCWNTTGSTVDPTGAVAGRGAGGSGRRLTTATSAIASRSRSAAAASAPRSTRRGRVDTGSSPIAARKPTRGSSASSSWRANSRSRSRSRSSVTSASSPALRAPRAALRGPASGSLRRCPRQSPGCRRCHGATGRRSSAAARSGAAAAAARRPRP